MERRQILAPLPIGFAVFLVHLATIPITGTGINPARSLGAAIIYNREHAWSDHVSEPKPKLKPNNTPPFLCLNLKAWHLLVFCSSSNCRHVVAVAFRSNLKLTQTHSNSLCNQKTHSYSLLHT